MSESVIAAIITGLVSLIGTVLAVWKSSSKTNKNLEINQAVINTEIKELTREVRAHNNFAQRMPVVEEQIKVINHRIDDLEDNEKRRA